MPCSVAKKKRSGLEVTQTCSFPWVISFTSLLWPWAGGCISLRPVSLLQNGIMKTPGTTELSLRFSEKRQRWNIPSVQTGNCYFLINDFKPSEESPLPSGIRGSCSSDIWWLITLINFSLFFKLAHLHFSVLERL